MGLINVLVNLLIYDDSAETNNPRIRLADISRQLFSIPTENSYSRKLTIPSQSSLTVAQTSRTLSQDATTQYTITLRSGSTYRWRWAAATNPVLRTKRNCAYDNTTQFDVSKSGDVVRYTYDGTGTAPNFVANGVIVGDVVHIETGSPFNALNEGTFTVVSVAATYFEVVNSNGVAELNIVLGANIDSVQPMDIYSAAGVQIGDQARIVSTAYNIENRGVFTVSEVTSNYFELSNGNPGIPEGPIAVGSANGIVFYPDIYEWLYVESDQKVSIRINGDTSDSVEVEPIVAGDTSKPGVYLQHGGVFRLDIANNGITTANVKIILAE